MATRELGALENSKLNIYGGDAADPTLGQIVDISKQHGADTLTLEFGTTLGKHRCVRCHGAWMTYRSSYSNSVSKDGMALDHQVRSK